jgi:ABC-type polysaccharide/polyol phosphate transport system ATPase subunit
LEIYPLVNKILHFAELQDFANVAIGTFSSGMIARLAFTATFFQINHCDILLLDEVLATGDASFNWRCLIPLQTDRD